MTDHIIKAAREAGIEFQQHRGITGRVNTMTCGSQHIDALARFYAIAYRQGMERAAEICDSWALRGDELSERILAEAHAKNQPESTHDTGNV